MNKLPFALRSGEFRARLHIQSIGNFENFFQGAFELLLIIEWMMP
jgi:hypothetical protein